MSLRRRLLRLRRRLSRLQGRRRSGGAIRFLTHQIIHGAVTRGGAVLLCRGTPWRPRGGDTPGFFLGEDVVKRPRGPNCNKLLRLLLSAGRRLYELSAEGRHAAAPPTPQSGSSSGYRPANYIASLQSSELQSSERKLSAPSIASQLVETPQTRESSSELKRHRGRPVAVAL